MIEKLRAGFAPFEAYLWKERARVEIWVSRAEYHYSAEERTFVCMDLNMPIIVAKSCDEVCSAEEILMPLFVTCK